MNKRNKKCIKCASDELIRIYKPSHEKKIECRVYWCRNCGSVRHEDLDGVIGWATSSQFRKQSSNVA